MPSAPKNSPTWLILITNLPGRNQTLRMRLWRTLKAAGAGLLKDGVYLLPSSRTSRDLFDGLIHDIAAARGNAFIVDADAQTPAQQAAFEALFDRSREYADFLRRLRAQQRQLQRLSEPEARQKLAALRREKVVLVARDFFPGKSREQAEAALAAAEQVLNRRFSPDEPRASSGELAPRDRATYRARTWATRERMWIDRVASAWLIRRFVDPKAKFIWLKQIRDCPKRAVGFDFQGAEFTHWGARVTFEVIVAAFGLDQDIGLSRLGALVHYLDVGGVPVPEAAGFASIMSGAREIQPNDDALLAAMAPVLDSLYTAYSQPDSPAD